MQQARPPPKKKNWINYFLLNPILYQIALYQIAQIWEQLQISAPKGPIAAKFCMDVKTHVKSIATTFFLAENGLFIMLLWFMQIRCIIITYLLIFPTNKISEGQFLAESFVEAL